MDKKIDEEYLKNLRKYFEKLVKERTKIKSVSILKNLTASLYITLLPFHDVKYKNKFISKAISLIN